MAIIIKVLRGVCKKKFRNQNKEKGADIHKA